MAQHTLVTLLVELLDLWENAENSALNISVGVPGRRGRYDNVNLIEVHPEDLEHASFTVFPNAADSAALTEARQIAEHIRELSGCTNLTPQKSTDGSIERFWVNRVGVGKDTISARKGELLALSQS